MTAAHMTAVTINLQAQNTLPAPSNPGWVVLKEH